MTADSAPIEWTERTVKVADLVPYEQNPRTISPAQRERLVASIREMGYHQRIIAQPDLKVIGGHQRIDVLKELGVRSIKVLTPSRDLTPDEYKRLLVQDNLPFGEFDWPKLGAQFSIDKLEQWGMDEAWLTKVPRTRQEEADIVPPLQDKATSQIGDLWVLEGHRLLCGDSTDAASVARLLANATPSLMVTDPPYGVEYDPAWREKAGVGSSKSAKGVVLNDDRADWRAAWKLFPGNVAYVWHGALHAPVVAESLEVCGFKIRSQIVWIKSRPALSRGHFHWQHEPAYYAQKPDTDDGWRFEAEHELALYAAKGKADWRGGRKQSTVWHIDHLKNDTGHGTQKPVECMLRPILNNSAAGACVYDPFMGSGTTLIASEQSGRFAYGLELSPHYVDVIVRRWSQFCGKQAILEGDGRSFAEIEKTRT